MNQIATYLSIAILIWLIGTAAIVTCLQRKYIGSMIRDIELIADCIGSHCRKRQSLETDG